MTTFVDDENPYAGEPTQVYASNWVSDGQGTNNEARALVGKSDEGYHPALDISNGGGDIGGGNPWHQALPTLEAAKEVAHKLLDEWQNYDLAPRLFENVQTDQAPAIVLSSLLKETHQALATGTTAADGESVSLVSSLQQFLEREFSTHAQQAALMDEARIFLNASSIGSILEVAEHILDEARENHLRDSDPVRTVDLHVREMLAHGDEPAALLEALDRWSNPNRNPDVSESLRLTVAEEWARKLALEQQPPSTIHASLTLNVPDSSMDGHSHASVANRIHSQIAGTTEQQAIPQMQPSSQDVAAPRH